LERLLRRRGRRIGLGEGHLEFVYGVGDHKALLNPGSCITTCCTQRELSGRPSAPFENGFKSSKGVSRVFGDDFGDLSCLLSFYQGQLTGPLSS
jgi:hypothetical protein